MAPISTENGREKQLNREFQFFFFTGRLRKKKKMNRRFRIQYKTARRRQCFRALIVGRSDHELFRRSPNV